jgi:hypothetical protein
MKPVNCDYLTLTSFDNTFWQAAKAYMQGQGQWDKRQDAAKMQYVGWQFPTSENGSVFLASGTQAGRVHNLMQISGDAARIAAESKFVRQQVTDLQTAKITRIDLQCTLAWAEDAHTFLWRAFNRLQKAGVTVGWTESVDRKWGKLATLYVGSRQNGKFWRFYMKPEGEEMRIRAEVELKRQIATSFGMVGNFEGAEGVYLHYLRLLPDTELIAPFDDACNGINPHMWRIVKEDTNTAKWLMETVYPALHKYLSAHDSGDSVAIAFGSLLDYQRGIK